MKWEGLGKRNISRFLQTYSCFIILLGLIIVSAALSDKFLSQQNIFNVLRQQAHIAILALGALIVILTGGIDLSSGAILGISNVFVAYFITNLALDSMGGAAISIAAAILAGGLAGFINGLLIAYLSMPAFIATLASMTMLRGVALVMTNGTPIRPPVDPLANPGSFALFRFGQDSDPLIGMPWPVWVTAVIVAFFWFLMKYTTFGRLTMATGSNEDATRLAGINVKMYKTAAYTLCGLLAGVAGVLLAARAGIAIPAAGSGQELTSIAAVVIGGASLSGGSGKVANTIVGVFILALIGNIMTLLAIPAYPQQIIEGAIIIAAVFLNRGKKKK
jgi:ribose transport system permease protein